MESKLRSIPLREPDTHYHGVPIWFEEMCYGLKNKNTTESLIFKNGILCVENGGFVVREVRERYDKWKLDKDIDEIILSDTDSIYEQE
jgi:hypothetical protein